MRVADLDKSVEGKRFRVTRAALIRWPLTFTPLGEAERSGYVNDSKRLKGRTGTAMHLNVSTYSSAFTQLWVEWDDKSPDGPGSLSLASEDEIEVITDLVDELVDEAIEEAGYDGPLPATQAEADRLPPSHPARLMFERRASQGS